MGCSYRERFCCKDWHFHAQGRLALDNLPLGPLQFESLGFLVIPSRIFKVDEAGVAFGEYIGVRSVDPDGLIANTHMVLNAECHVRSFVDHCRNSPVFSGGDFNLIWTGSQQALSIGTFERNRASR